MKKIYKTNFVWITFIILISLVGIYPLFSTGFYPFHDEPQIANLYQMIRILKDGQFPPRWAPDMSFNYGYPLFNFYYQLPFYLGSFFNLVLGFSLVQSLKLVFLLSLPLSGISFFFLAKKYFPVLGAFGASLLYMFTPYRAVDLYVRGAVGELWSFVFMPLVLLSFINLTEERKTKNLIFAGLSLAGLILSHNLSAIVFLPFVGIFCLVLILSDENKFYRFVSSFFGLILGLGLSAYYWLPAVLEKRYVQTGTPFNPIDHFPFIKQLIIPSWGYGASLWGPYDGMSFQIGLVNIAGVLLAVIFFFLLRRNLKKEIKFLFGFILFSLFFVLFLMNIRSLFIWNIIPLGDYVQFPWRLLMLATLFSSILIGFLGLFKNRFLKFLPLFFGITSILITWNYFKPEKIINVDDEYYLNRFFAAQSVEGETKIVSNQYFNYSEDYLPLTIWTKERPKYLPVSKIELKKGQVFYTENHTNLIKAKVEAPEETLMTVNNYYFPGWKIFVDGKEQKIGVDMVSGNMRVLLPQGEHNVEVIFKNTLVRTIANFLSAFSLALIVFLLTIKKVRNT